LVFFAVQPDFGFTCRGDGAGRVFPRLVEERGLAEAISACGSELATQSAITFAGSNAFWVFWLWI
jgi:hypothetical protein